MPFSPAAEAALNLAADFVTLPEDRNSGRRMPKIRRKQQTRTQGVELSKRAILVDPSAVDDAAGRFSMIATTETPVRTSIPDPLDPTKTIEVDEVLLASGLDFSRVPGMPLMDNHMLERGLEATLGRVDNVRVEGTEVHADGVYAPSRKSIAADQKAGFYPQVSAGFTVNEYVITEREGQVPLAEAVSWTLHEVSIVPVGADPNAIVTGTRGKKLYPLPAFTRKRSKTRKQERNMDETQIEDLVIAAEEAIDEAIAAVEDAVDADVEVSDELLERARGLRKFRGKRNKRARAEEDDAAEDEVRSKRKRRRGRGRRDP
ncbi:hypothetical protein ASD54_08740 [Rhizobium sp. Root149]|nr:hypothetical protein ASD54_08740 [Rhizobium sp. Root149]